MMGPPVKLSDELVTDARLTAEVAERSIAGQIEYWAGIGRAVEPLLRTDKVLALKRLGTARPLSACLGQIETKAGRERLADILQERPYPHYEASKERPGFLVREDENGEVRIGRFVNRKFVEEKQQSPQ